MVLVRRSHRRSHHDRQRDLLAEKTIAAGGLLRSPTKDTPFRVLYRTCERCGLHISTPADLILQATGRLPPCQRCHDTRMAEETLRRGWALHPPRSSPFRLLASSCPRCGHITSTPLDQVRRADPGNEGRRCRQCASDASSAYNKRMRTERDPHFLARARRAAAEGYVRGYRRTVDGAVNRGKEWTGPELEVAGRPDLTAEEVALLLGRTTYAVKHMRRLLRIDPRKITLAGRQY